MTEEQIQALQFYRRSNAFDEKEKAVILYADRMTRGAAPLRDGTLQELAKHFNEAQIVELTLVVAIANFTNRVNDALQTEPDIGVK